MGFGFCCWLGFADLWFVLCLIVLLCLVGVVAICWGLMIVWGFSDCGLHALGRFCVWLV